MMDIFDKFSNTFPVTKDVGSIRTKGTMLENIDAFVTNNYNVNIETAVRYSGTFISMIERNRINVNETVGLYTAYARMGIPSVVIGVKSKEDWVNLRKSLRDADLVR